MFVNMILMITLESFLLVEAFEYLVVVLSLQSICCCFISSDDQMCSCHRLDTESDVLTTELSIFPSSTFLSK